MSKKIVFLSGCPGSGKSFLANKLHKKALDNGLTSIILSTDNFFIHNGEYKWSGNHIANAHRWCQGLFYREVFIDTQNIILDNTFLTAWQFYPYVETAVKFEYDWSIVPAKTKWAKDPAECAKRNSHGVSEDAIKKMLDKSESPSIMERELRAKFKC